MVITAKVDVVTLAISATLVSSVCLDGKGACFAAEDTSGTVGLNISFLQRGVNVGGPASTSADTEKTAKPVGEIGPETKQRARALAHYQTNSGKRTVLPSCAASWGTFGDTPLTQSQKVPFNGPPESFLQYRTVTAHRIEQPFVSTEYGFGMCTITKVASTEWADIFYKIVLNDTGAVHSGEDRSSEIPIYHTAEDMATVFGDPNSVTAVLVREPLSRFMSAFVAKCTPGNTMGTECFPAKDANHLEDTSMKDAVEWVLAQDLSIHEHTVDRHWGLQSNYCELYDRVQEYDYVLVYNKSTLAADATCLMEIAGIDRFNSLGPANDNAPYWHEISATDEEEIAQLKLMFTPEAAKRVMQKYIKDYITFNFPEPAWIAGATGALYETPIGEYM